MILGDIEEHLKGKSRLNTFLFESRRQLRFWNLVHLKYIINQTAFTAAMRSGEKVYCLLQLT